jgi:hypothetical protein
MTVDIAELPRQHPNNAYTIDPAEVRAMQLAAVRERFEALRPRIRVLESVAADVGVDRIDALEDVVPLCFPHTLYKSCSAGRIAKGRFDRLTEWLDGFTVHDLSSIDTSRCDSLESWLDAVEQGSDLRPTVTSGTTGKISFFPRSTTEAAIFAQLVVQALAGFADEADSGLDTGEPEWFSPLPIATGRQGMARMFDLIRRHCYGGDATRIHTLGRGHWDADMLWVWGRMRQAEARGETAQLELTPALERVRAQVIEAQQSAARDTDRFLEELSVEFRGRRVILFGPTGTLINLAGICRDRGLAPEFGPESFILAGGGNKGQAFPSGWQELLYGVFPKPHAEVYAMTEITALCRLCSAGWFHWSPTVVTFLIDPDTSEPLPRTGVQTGRLALFDLCATTYWGGAVSGDRVTIDWDGGCPCGRTGARVRNDVTRYSELRDDDKITCAKSPGAYERAVDTVVGLA